MSQLTISIRVLALAAITFSFAAVSHAGAMPQAEVVSQAETVSQAEAMPLTEAPAVCFAKGTPEWKVAEVTSWVNARNAGMSLQTQFGFNRFQGLPATRWTSTASNPGGLGQGDPMTLTWSYVPDGTTIAPQIPGESNDPSSMQAWLNGIYGNFATWHALFVQVFDRWSELTGVTYIYEPNDDGVAMFGSSGLLGVRGDVRIGAHRIDGTSNVLAYNFFPNNGDMVLDANDGTYNNLSNNSLVLRNILAHEHGHGLGMSHVCPVQGTKLMEPFLATGFDGPQHDDILGGQRGYGDTDEHLSDTFLTAPTLVSMAADRSIDDNTDVDWFEFQAAAGETISVELRPVGFTYLNGPQNPNGSCSPGTNFNSLTQSNLDFEIRAADGVTVLASANLTGAGQSESVTGLTLANSGTHYVRITGANDAAQLYEIDLMGAAIFADGFEAGNTASWSATNP